MRVSLPLKDQVAANAVRKQLRDLSHKIGSVLTLVQPVFVRKKLGKELNLNPKKARRQVISCESAMPVHVLFILNLVCVMQIMLGIQPDTFTNALLNKKVRQLADIFWKLTVGKIFWKKTNLRS